MGKDLKEGGSGSDDDRYGQTPRDRDKECVNCGVERITMRGTDPITGLLLYVGDKCSYMVRRSPDITPIDN